MQFGGQKKLNGSSSGGGHDISVFVAHFARAAEIRPKSRGGTMKEQPSPPPPLPLPPPSPAAAAAAGCVVDDGCCSGAPAEDSPAPAQPQRKRHPTRCRHCHRDCIYFRSRSSAFLLFSNSTVFVVKMSGQVNTAVSSTSYMVKYCCGV